LRYNILGKIHISNEEECKGDSFFYLCASSSVKDRAYADQSTAYQFFIRWKKISSFNFLRIASFYFKFLPSQRSRGMAESSWNQWAHLLSLTM
jgi:hypothetical protein